jgi:hypothetical protein
MAEFVDVVNMNLNDPNLTPSDGRKFPKVDPGTYAFEIEKATFDQSKKGNKTLKITAKVLDDGPMKDRNMIGSYVIDNEDFSRRRMKAIVEGTGVVLDKNGSFKLEDLQGLCFTADVILDEYEALNEKTGMKEMRSFTKWVSERPVEGAAPTATATAPANAANAPRRPAAPNGTRTAPRNPA